MKLKHLLAIAAASSLALVACEKHATTATEEKADEAKAAVDKKIEDVKEVTKEKTAEAAAKIDNAVDAAKDTGAKAVDATKDAAAKAADAVKAAVSPSPN